MDATALLSFLRQLGGQTATARLPALNPVAPGGYLPSPMPVAPPPSPPAGLLPSPSPTVPPPASPQPAGLLGLPQPATLPAPQPITPLAGAPQQLSPVLSGGGPALPRNGLPSAMAREPGFLDFLSHPDMARALMEGGLRMLSAGAPSTNPASGSFAHSLAQGGLGFLSGADAAREQREDLLNNAVNRQFKQAIIGTGNESIDLQRYYDEEGRETFGYWDPAQGRMVQVGGAKGAPAVRGGGTAISMGPATATPLSGDLTTKDKQIINAIPSLLGVVDKYEAALRETPVNLFDRLASGVTTITGPELTELETLRTQVIMQLKELQGLGAPQAGDLALLAAQITDPSSLWGIGRGPEGMLEQLSAIRDLAGIIGQTYGVEVGQTSAPELADPLGLFQ